MANSSKKEKQPLAKGWIKVQSKTYPNREYYYNLKTKCSSWTNPCEEQDRSTSSSSIKDGKKNLPSTFSSSLSLIDNSRKRKKRKRKKSNETVNVSVPSKINNNIEDYDEHQEQYFESVLGKTVRGNEQNTEIKSKSTKEKILGDTSKTFKVSSQKISSKLANQDLCDRKQVEKEVFPNRKKKISVDNTPDSGPVKDAGKFNRNDGSESIGESTFKEKNHKEGRISFKIPAQTRLLKLKETLSKNAIPNSKEITLRKFPLKGKTSKAKTEANKGYSSKGKTPAQMKLLKLKENFTTLHSENESEKEYCRNHFPSPSVPSVSESMVVNDNLHEGEVSSLLDTKLKRMREQHSDEKTPAQAKLLKLRRQLSNEIGDLVQPWQKSRNETPALVNKSFEPFSFANPKSQLKVDVNCSSSNIVDFVEAMDWDPIDDELDAKFINEFCGQMEVCKDILSDDINKINSLNCSSTLSNSWILVPDTNIFVADLDFIHEIRDIDVPGFGYPIIYVPWRVLQELDYLKDSKIDSHKKRLSLNARKSISYINENFKLKQSRFCGQSFEDFMNMVNTNISNPDDEILETCLKLRKQYADNKVVLLTNDRNLESKAIVSNLEAYSKDEFKVKFLSRTYSCDKKETDSEPNDEVERDLKRLLNHLISKVVEDEMEKAFGTDWIKICHKKPPWTLQDALKSFMKHWRSVFFILFSKDVFSNAEKLYKLLYKSNKGFAQNCNEILDAAGNLVKSLKIVPKSYVPYQRLGDEILEKLASWDKSKSQDLQTNQLTQENSPLSLTSAHSHNLGNKTDIDSQSQSENYSDDFALIKDLFLNIWESLKSFCVAVSELIQQGGPSNFNQMSEARSKLHDTYAKVSTLISLLDLLARVKNEDIGESHPLIIQLDNYLINLFSSMLPDVKRKLRKALVIFCSSLEGRSAMEKLSSELTNFMGCLVEAKNYLDSCYSS